MRLFWAYIGAIAATYTLASVFFTQQVLAAGTGYLYTAAQKAETYLDNFIGLAPAYGVVIAIALLIGFLIAAGLKRVLKPLAPVAYPLAGAAAIFTAIWLIENVMAAGGAGAISGARTAFGVALQCLAGAVGGTVFALLSRRKG